MPRIASQKLASGHDVRVGGGRGHLTTYLMHPNRPPWGALMPSGGHAPNCTPGGYYGPCRALSFTIIIGG